MYLSYIVITVSYTSYMDRHAGAAAVSMSIMITAQSNQALPYLHQFFHYHPLDQDPRPRSSPQPPSRPIQVGPKLHNFHPRFPKPRPVPLPTPSLNFEVAVKTGHGGSKQVNWSSKSQKRGVVNPWKCREIPKKELDQPVGLIRWRRWSKGWWWVRLCSRPLKRVAVGWK